MSQVYQHVSNRLDLLAEALARVTAQPLPSPFTPEIVVVQSAAARRWLSLRIAELHQVCANYEFPFLGTVIARLIADAQDGAPLAERPSPDTLTWRIDSALRRRTADPEFAAVARYLADGDALKCFALAGRVAGLFDQYRVYRPDLLAPLVRAAIHAICWRRSLAGQALAGRGRPLRFRCRADPAAPQRLSRRGPGQTAGPSLGVCSHGLGARVSGPAFPARPRQRSPPLPAPPVAQLSRR